MGETIIDARTSIALEVCIVQRLQKKVRKFETGEPLRLSFGLKLRINEFQFVPGPLQ